ncbi:MAG: AMP-binding protein [Bdellovibrionota bacterium]
MNIDWHSQESHIFINPRTPNFEKNKLYSIIEKHQLKSHIFIATSGSTATQSTDIKWVALKKSSFLISAQAVNSHLNCTKNDIFLNTLPHFHVGGLAMFARVQVCGAKIIDIYNENSKWNALQYVEQLENYKITISSLVPTQVFDLVKNNCKAPVTLRAIVVGGGNLSHELFLQAQKLNWPLLPSYGMTECCSQIATALPNCSWNSNHAELTVLPHMHVSISSEGKIQIAGESLLTGYILQTENESNFMDPKIEDKIITSDVGELKNNKLFIYGRNDENIKINGENVSLLRLQAILEQAAKKAHLKTDCAVIAMPEARQGQKIVLVFCQTLDMKLEDKNINSTVANFNELVFPFERSKEVYFVDEIPRTELGKLKRNLITKMIKT